MSWVNDLWSSVRPKAKSTNLSDLLDHYDLVHVNDIPGQQFAIVSPKTTNMHEIGTSAPSPWTSFGRKEYNIALQGSKGLEAFDKMRKSDGVVRGTLRATKTPVLSGRWFVEKGGTSEDDKAARDLVEWNLFRNRMSISWMQILTESLLMLDFGYYMFELVWENRDVEGKMRTVIKKFAPRHPMDVKEWVYDSHGGPLGVVFHSPTGKLEDEYFIPIDKLVVFTFDREAGDLEGVSILRSAYKHWYFKEQLYKIDAIQKERHGIGIPIIKLPMGFSDNDKKLAEQLGRNIRTNERAHITLPPGWDLTMLKLEGQPVNALDSIDQHDGAIRENIMANFIRDGAREEDLVMFLKATRFIGDIVADAFNHYVIPKIVANNFSNTDNPTLRVRRIGEAADWRTLTFAIRNLIGAGVIIPDEQLEINLRSEMDLPEIDYDTARLIQTPQNPYDMQDALDPNNPDFGKVDSHGTDNTGSNNSGNETHNNNNPLYKRKKKPLGSGGLPRQSLVSNQKNAFGLPAKSAGKDTGGK
jgi:hypothetical protein